MDKIARMKVFLRVADLQGFSRAAEDLGLPKASISVAIQELETELGTQLFHRTTRRVQTTPDGQTYYRRCRELLAQIDEVDGLFKQDDSQIRGRIRFDMPMPIARNIVIPRLPEFVSKYPGIHLELSSTDRKVDVIREGFDGVIRVGSSKDSGLIQKVVGKYVLLNCVSPAYIEKYGKPRTIADLDQHYLIRYGSTLGTGDDNFEYHDGKRWQQKKMRSLITVNNTDAYQASCLAGFGIVQSPETGARPLIAAGRLIEVLPKYRAAPMPLSIVYPQRKNIARRVQLFIDWLVQTLPLGYKV